MLSVVPAAAPIPPSFCDLVEQARALGFLFDRPNGRFILAGTARRVTAPMLFVEGSAREDYAATLASLRALHAAARAVAARLAEARATGALYDRARSAMH